jgi:hypothetical protein
MPCRTNCRQVRTTRLQCHTVHVWWNTRCRRRWTCSNVVFVYPWPYWVYSLWTPQECTDVSWIEHVRYSHVIRHQLKTSPNSPVHVTICSSPSPYRPKDMSKKSTSDLSPTDMVTFRISDQGGGLDRTFFPPDQPLSVWSFARHGLNHHHHTSIGKIIRISVSQCFLIIEIILIWLLIHFRFGWTHSISR